VDGYGLANGPALCHESPLKHSHPGLIARIIRRSRHEYANAPHPPLLLRPRRVRPRGRRAAEQRHELAPPDHSITSSARCCRNQGTSRPSALAVLRLSTSSNFVGNSTGKSEGFVPCRILCTSTALRPKDIGYIGAVRHQSAGLRELPKYRGTRQTILER